MTWTRRPHNWCPTCSDRHSPRCTDGMRWPLEPLLAMLGDRNLKSIYGESNAGVAVIAERGLDTWQADRWAVKAGFHPAQVWGWEWVEAGLTVVDRQRLEGGWRQAWLWLERGAEQQEAKAA